MYISRGMQRAFSTMGDFTASAISNGKWKAQNDTKLEAGRYQYTMDYPAKETEEWIVAQKIWRM